MPPAGRRLDGSGPPRRAPRSSSRWRVLAACAAFLALLPTGARANADDESQPDSPSGSSSSHGHASSSVDDVTVEEFALDGPESVQDHVNVAMKEARTRPDYDAAVNPILEGGWVRARAVAAATARGDIRPPISSTRLLGIGAASAEGDDAWGGTARLSGGGDDGAAPTPSPAEIEVDAETSSSINSDEEEEDAARRSQTWGRRDVLGGMLVDSNDDDGPDADDPNAARSLVRGNSQLSSSSIAEIDRMRRARDCGDSIAAGAVASAGGLSTNLREWAAVEDEDASFVKVSDVPWMVAMEAGERNAREEKRISSKLNNSTASAASSSPSSSSASIEVRDKEETELTERYDTLLAWVLDKGGVVANGVNVSKVNGKPGDGRGLVTTGLTESSSSGGDESSSIVNVGDAVARIPIALALSHVAARTYRVNDQPVGTLLRPLFNEQPTYALAMMLLHERFKLVHALESPWGPYVKTLRHVEPSAHVLQTMRGTYAEERRREWEQTVEAAHDWIVNKGCTRGLQAMCARKPGRHYAASGTFNMNDVRWAMGIVRARAVWISRSTTGTTFPALIPLLDLIPHRPGSGGSMKLGVDNVVTVTSGKTFTPGSEPSREVFIDRETNATDADLLLAHHALAPGTNPHNAVRMRLPGTEISRVGVIRKIELLRSWRKEMAMPPRGSDLWRGAKGLGLYGDGDEDELSAMEDTKKKKRGRKRAIAALAAKEGGGGSMTIEEELMLTNEAFDPKEAAEKAAARIGVDLSLVDDFDEDDDEAYALYSAPDPNLPGGDDPSFDHHRKSLARLAAQTAAAAAYADLSADDSGVHSGLHGFGGDLKARSDGGDATTAALNASRAFFEKGAPPPRGLDPLDLFLLRKGNLMSECGESDSFVITAAGPSDALMCATRVLLANETEVKALEGGGADPHWSGSRSESESETARLVALGLMHEPFDASRPLSPTNERAAIRRIATAATNILGGYGSTEEDDLASLNHEDPDAISENSNAFEDSARVPGGLLASAVTLRLRERRMLMAAVYNLRTRQETLGALDFQVEEKERKRLDRERFEREREERVLELSKRFAERRILASLDVDVVQPLDDKMEDNGGQNHPDEPKTRKATVEVREGDDMERVVRDFMRVNSIPEADSTVTQLTNALTEKVDSNAEKSPNPFGETVGRCAVIVPDGRKAVVSPRVKEDLAEVVRGFAEVFRIPRQLVPALVDRVNATIAKRSERKTLLELRVRAPDGRLLTFDVKDGEQHDLVESAREWALAERVHLDAAVQVANAAFERLPPVLIQFPVDVPGRVRASMAIRDKDEAAVRRTCEAFCEALDLGGGETTVNALIRGAMARLNPGAVLVDADAVPLPKNED